MSELNCFKHKYKIFSLNVDSDFILEELAASDGNAHLEIINGIVPAEIYEPIVTNKFFQSSAKEALLIVRKVAKFYISKGERVIVQPDKESDYSRIKQYLYGIVMEILLLQRGIVAIHSSAVVIDGKCILVTGKSGAGKSTLAIALKEMDCPFLTDDVAYLTCLDDGSIWVNPGFPEHKLCKDSVEAIGLEIDANLCCFLEKEDKYFMSTGKSYQTTPARLYAIYELIPDKCKEVRIIKIEGMQKFVILARQTYPTNFLKSFGLENEYFRKLSNIAENISFYQIARPEIGFSYNEQIRLIKKQLGGRNQINFNADGIV